MVTLIIEAALVANFVPSNNNAALQAAVAMFFVYQIFYVSQIPVHCRDVRWSWIGRMSRWHPILLPWRTLSNTPPSKRSMPWRFNDLSDEHHLAPICSNGIQYNKLALLPLLYHSWIHRCSNYVVFLPKYKGLAIRRNCCDIWRCARGSVVSKRSRNRRYTPHSWAFREHRKARNRWRSEIDA